MFEKTEEGTWETKSAGVNGRMILVLSSESPGMYCRVVKQISTDVSEIRAASIIRAMLLVLLDCDLN
jgi:hypothetical protein